MLEVHALIVAAVGEQRRNYSTTVEEPGVLKVA